MKTQNRMMPSRLWGGLAVAVLAALTMAEDAVAQLKVAVMPSYTQSRTYANAALNEPITVWGRTWGGTAPYSYEFDLDNDGTADVSGGGVPASGTIAGNRELSTVHTFTSAGSKTIRLTVTDSLGATASRTAVIRVIVAPTHEERVNMAIEKGLLYNYRSTIGRDSSNIDSSARVYWQQSGGDRGQAYTGAVILAFEENGHSEDNDDEEDIYAEVVRKGLQQVLTTNTGYVNLTPHSDGIAVRDSDGANAHSVLNGKGAYFYGGYHGTYSTSWAALALILSKKSAADAAAAIVSSGPFAGQSYYQVIQDVIDMYSYSQGDGARRGGWEYEIHLQDGGRYDGSAQQWGQLVFRAAIDLWGLQPQQWMIDNSDYGFQVLQNANGGVGYSNNSGWLNTAKTGGALVGWSVANKGIGDSNVDSAISFIGTQWKNQREPGWAGGFYAMYGLKKGLQLMGIETLNTSAGVRDWYNDLSAWLLGNASLLDPGIASSRRNTGWSFGQNANGSWNNVGWIANGPFSTANAILILTRSVTIPLPVAVIEPVSVQPRNFAFDMDGSNSFHLDPSLEIVLYEWDFNDDGVFDATGPKPTNPGYAAAGTYPVTLRVTDNNPEGAQTDIATIDVEVTDQNAPPVAIAIPAGVPAYSGKVGEDITLDGSDSFDPEGDPIIEYSWDLNGDGIYGDAFGPNPVVSFDVIYSGQIGLQVTSLEDAPGAEPKTSTNSAFIDVFISPSNFFITSFSADIVVPGEEANVTAVVSSAGDSGQDFTDVEVKFYDGNPFLNGSPVGPTLTVDLPIGGSATLSNINLAGLGGIDEVFVFVDSNAAIGEYDEEDNTAVAGVSNTAPIVACQDIQVNVDANCVAVVTAAQVDGGTIDPDGDIVSLSLSPAGPYGVGVHVVTLTATDPAGASSSCEATITVSDAIAPLIALNGPANMTLECGVDSYFELGAMATDNCGVGEPVPSGEVLDTPGTYEIAYNVTDVNGNPAATVIRTITVEDTIAPDISCPGDLVLECPADTSVGATGSATATDECSAVEISYSDVVTPGCGGSHTITRTWVAVDASGNASDCVQTIEVIDTTAPTLVISDNFVSFSPKDVPVTFTISTADDCSDVALDLVVNAYKLTKKGERVDKLAGGSSSGSSGSGSSGSGSSGSAKPPVFEINGNQVTINDSKGVGTFWEIIATATDACDNVTSETYTVEVVKPTKGSGSSGSGSGGSGSGSGSSKGSKANEGVGNGVDGNTPGHDNNGGNDDPGNTPGNPGAKEKSDSGSSAAAPAPKAGKKGKKGKK